jgi:hypothetical protein
MGKNEAKTSNNVNFSSSHRHSRIAPSLRHGIDLDPEIGVRIEPLNRRRVAAVQDAADGENLTPNDAQIDATVKSLEIQILVLFAFLSSCLKSMLFNHIFCSCGWVQ